MRALLLSALVLVGVACSEAAPVGPFTSRQQEFALTDDSDFVRKAPPRGGEWLDRFPERGESFGDYVRSSPVRAEGARRALAFVRVGEFDARQERIAKAAIRFAGRWFRLPVEELPSEPLPATGWSRVRVLDGRPAPLPQYRTDYFLRHLLTRLLPDDAVCLTAVTMADLYPQESWNFVFGQSSLTRRVAVSSFARYFAAFDGRPETPESERMALRRAIAVIVHEIGHAFGLRHCVEYECAMNGSNSLEESDRQPLRLCPPCLRKLRWNLGFDVSQRYVGLFDFYREHGLGEEASWVRHRMERIAAVPK